MNKIYTIGFTKKNAETFFSVLERHNISKVVDIRLNNTSQLAGFTKYPDIKFFLKEISDIIYIYDPLFAPTNEILRNYKSKKITWEEYIIEFNKTMNERKIKEHILKEYSFEDNLCLLCSEFLPINCHRSIVAKIFKELFDCEVIHL